MTLEQEIKLAAKNKKKKAAKEAAEKAYEKGYKEAAVHEKLENAKKLRVAGVSLEIISKCTGLSLEEVEAL